ncbi:MAG: hypothetical protein ABEJ31_08150 [Haloarculaceae archaeon]
MEVWTWIVAYVVGFSLLQLLVYRYFRDSDASVEGPPHGPGERYSPAVDGLERDAPRGREATGDGRYCPHCGATNEPDASFRYCRECASPLR